MDFEQTLEGIQRWEVSFKSGKEALDNGRYEDAEDNLNRAYKSAGKHGINDPRMANICETLADLYCKKSEYQKAGEFYLQVIQIWESTLGPKYSGLIKILNNYAEILEKLNQMDEATEMRDRAERIRLQDRG